MVKRTASSAGLKQAQQARKAQRKGIMCTLRRPDGFRTAPFPRKDVPHGTTELHLPRLWDTDRYTLDHIDAAGVHHYSYAGTVSTTTSGGRTDG